MNTTPKGSRAGEPVVNQDIDDQPHCCGYCGTRTSLDDATYYATGDMNHTCPHCEQRYRLTEDEDDDGELVPLDGEGEIEILDEATGEVIGMTKATEERLSALDGALADLAPEREMLEASLGDLERLFGIAPSPYGPDFGSF